MSRLDYLTIGIVAICIALLIYLVYSYVNLPHTPPNQKAISEKPYADSSQYQKNETAGYPEDDSSAVIYRPSPGAAVDTESVPNVPVQTKTVTKPVPEKMESKPSPAKTATETNEAKPKPIPESGRYMVIAGSFEQLSSAQDQLRKVKKLGYGGARIEKFNRGTYASVLVNRFGRPSDAKALVNALKSKGIDAMVLEKR